MSRSLVQHRIPTPNNLSQTLGNWSGNTQFSLENAGCLPVAIPVTGRLVIQKLFHENEKKATQKMTKPNFLLKINEQCIRTIHSPHAVTKFNSVHPAFYSSTPLCWVFLKWTFGPLLDKSAEIHSVLLSTVIPSSALPAPALNLWLSLIKYLRSAMIKVHPAHLGSKIH